MRDILVLIDYLAVRTAVVLSLERNVLLSLKKQYATPFYGSVNMAYGGYTVNESS